MKFSIYLVALTFAWIITVSGFEKAQSQDVSTLKQLAIKTIIKQGLPVPDAAIPIELSQQIKQEMLGGREIDFLAILKKIPVARENITSLRPVEFIISLSPNGKKLLVHHSENLTFSIYEADSGKRVCEIPRHCDCVAAPIHAFNYDGSDLAFITHCYKKKQDTLEIFRPGYGEMQTILFNDFCAQAVALSDDGSILVCAGGCGIPLRIYKRQSHTADFELVNTIGAGYIIALSHDNTRVAALTHGDLTVYDLETTQKLYQQKSLDLPNLQFCLHSDDVLVAAPGLKQDRAAAGVSMRLMEVPVPPETFLPSVAICLRGQKITSLVNGAPRFTYLVEGNPENFMELAKSDDEKFNLVRLHDNDTVVTVCTHHEVYRYNVKQLSQAESRFAKSVDEMAIDDVPVALALLQMTVADCKRRASQSPVLAEETRVDKEVRELMFPQSSTTQSPSFLQRMQLPLVGVAGFFLALCAVCN